MSYIEDLAKEMFEEENLDADEFDVEDGYNGFETVVPGTLARVVPIHGYSPEYGIADNMVTAYELAVAILKQDFEYEPELFDVKFLTYYVDEDKLRNDLLPDVSSAIYDDLEYEMERDLEDVAERVGIDVEKYENEDYDVDEEALKAAVMDNLDDYAREEAESLLSDPYEYIKDMFGDEEAAKWVVEHGYIDEDRMIEDAISSDGIGHFLGTYDGSIEELPSGGVYWRTN